MASIGFLKTKHHKLSVPLSLAPPSLSLSLSLPLCIPLHLCLSIPPLFLLRRWREREREGLSSTCPASRYRSRHQKPPPPADSPPPVTSASCDPPPPSRPRPFPAQIDGHELSPFRPSGICCHPRTEARRQRLQDRLATTSLIPTAVRQLLRGVGAGGPLPLPGRRCPGVVQGAASGGGCYGRAGPKLAYSRHGVGRPAPRLVVCRHSGDTGWAPWSENPTADLSRTTGWVGSMVTLSESHVKPTAKRHTTHSAYIRRSFNFE